MPTSETHGNAVPYLLPALEEPPEDWHQTGGRHVSVPFQPNGTLSVLTWGPQVQLRAMSLAHLEFLGGSLQDSWISHAMAYLIILLIFDSWLRDVGLTAG